MLTMTLTTRARGPTTLPVNCNGSHESKYTTLPYPMVVYARDCQGFLSLLGINVTAIIEIKDGHQVTMELWENGADNKNLHQLPLNLKFYYTHMT